MSVKRRKAGLVISWQKPFSILAPWRKGKGDKDAVLDGEVVLTKMKLFSHFGEKTPPADDSMSTMSTASTMSVSVQDISDPTKASEMNPGRDGGKSDRAQMESTSDYLTAIFSDPQVPRLYKFESEDSGVELPSGANSPSTPTGSEQSFVVHSRESSCDSSNLNPGPATASGERTPRRPSADDERARDSSGDGQTVPGVRDPSVGISFCESVEKTNGDESAASETVPEGDAVPSEQPEENSQDTSAGGGSPPAAHDQTSDDVFEPLRRSPKNGSIEEYMDECCRISQAQQSSDPPGSGLGYLEHICQLMEKIGRLQETNLRLQRQICGLQKDVRLTKTKEDFFQHHCSCGAAGLAFQDVHVQRPRSEIASHGGTLSDLTTIPEVTRHPLAPARRDVKSEGPTSAAALWRRSLNRRSYTEGEERFLCDSTDRLSGPHRRLSENYTWGRVKDLVRKTKLRNQSRLGLATSGSLKMSCPQLYRPDVGREEPVAGNRNSMIALGHHSKLDFPWLQ